MKAMLTLLGEKQYCSGRNCASHFTGLEIALSLSLLLLNLTDSTQATKLS